MVVSPSFISHYLLRFKKFCEYIKKRWVDKEARRFTVMVEVFADRLISRLPVDFASFLKGLDFYYVDFMDWRLPNITRITQKYKEMLDHLYMQYDRNYNTPFVLNILLEIRAYRMRFREYCGPAALARYDVEVIARGFLNMPPVQPVAPALLAALPA
jgi:hypothetical protein